MDNAELFLEKYKRLEEVVRSVYRLDVHDSIPYALGSKAKYRRFSSEIKYCQEVRNLLSHKRKVGGRYPVEPTQPMLNFIDRLIDEVCARPKCSDIMRKMRKLYWQPMDGSVRKAMEVMHLRNFTHVPLLSEGLVVGVFDENSVFNCLTSGSDVRIGGDLTFADIRDSVLLEGRENEEFIFFRADAYAEELEEEFEAAYRRGKRIGIAFITAGGSPDEPLQGIVTPLDILASD